MKKDEAREVNQPATVETKEERRERKKLKKQSKLSDAVAEVPVRFDPDSRPSYLSKPLALLQAPFYPPVALAPSSALSPPLRPISPQPQIWFHHGKQDTEGEHKKKREERTGVVESHEQRKERRAASKMEKRDKLEREDKQILKVRSMRERLCGSFANPSALDEQTVEPTIV